MVLYDHKDKEKTKIIFTKDGKKTNLIYGKDYSIDENGIVGKP